MKCALPAGDEMTATMEEQQTCFAKKLRELLCETYGFVPRCMSDTFARDIDAEIAQTQYDWKMWLMHDAVRSGVNPEIVCDCLDEFRAIQIREML